MKIFSHGVSSCICVETNVILSRIILKIYRLRALGSIPNYTPSRLYGLLFENKKIIKQYIGVRNGRYNKKA